MQIGSEIPDRIFRHSYPTRTRPATRNFVQYPTRPDIEKSYRLGTASLPAPQKRRKQENKMQN